MSKTLHILRYEIATAFGRKSFLFTAFCLPLLAGLVFLGVSILKDKNPSPMLGTGGGTTEPHLKTEGYVDHTGLITAIPPDVPEGVLVPYLDEAGARQALTGGEITAYYVIPADYVRQGDLIYINPDYRLAAPTDQSWTMRRTIFASLLGNDTDRIDRAWHAMDVHENALAPRIEQRDQENSLTFFIPYATMLILYLIILMSATLLLNSVTEEKKNRVMEILLLRVSSRQMLMGKIIGLGILGLLQAVIWVGTGYALLSVGGQRFNLAATYQLPFSIVVWGIVFFLLGYAVYASLLAGLGALVPNMQEASQATFVIIWPLLIPMFLVVILIEHTHGALAIGLSLFPLTAPVAMVTRLAAGGVPLWQPCIAAFLLLVTVVLVMRAVSRMFHAQTLLSGQPFSVKRYYGALVGRE